jgi:hypothetical protein
MDQISIKTLNPKCRLFLKLTRKGTWRQCLRPPPFLGFVRGGKGSESGQIHCVLHLYTCTYSHREGGEVNWREDRGALVYKTGQKYQHD